ncbi:MAG: DsrE family protein [Flavobacteriaceae bacterium]|nr:DsrE family protein [Flavobacteriaceae bacterium]
MKKLVLPFVMCLIISLQTTAQENQGIIKDFGQTFLVENPDVKTDMNANHKIIFDVTQSSEDKSVVNKYIDTAARFLNMHAKAGLKPEQLHVAMTIHGGAWQDVMTNEAYKEKFGVDNPNFELINQLTEAGVDVIICGQTAGARGLNKTNVNPNVKFALSAMTALLQYQNNGYRFMKF